MTLIELGQHIAAGYAPEVEVHGIGPMLYPVYVVVGDVRRPVKDERGRTVSFPSRAAAQRALADSGLTRATFVHTSAYGEMIGVTGDSRDTGLRETLILAERPQA